MEKGKKVVNKKRNKKIVIAGIIILAIIIFVIFMKNRSKNTSGMMGNIYTVDTVQKRDIVSQLSGTGTLSPANSYLVSALISGKILNADFEEGDIVDVDSVLYQVDSSDAQNNFDKASNSYLKSQNDYERLLEKKNDLNVTTNEGGTVVDLNVNVGDEVQEGQTVAIVRNSKIMSITLSFNSDDVDKFSLGQEAEITIDGSFEKLKGTISKIKNVEEVIDGFRIIKEVTIDVVNPGGISTNTKATAIVDGVACVASSNFTYKSETDVKAKISGEVKTVNVTEGENVNKNQVIITLSSSTLEENIENSLNTIKDMELSLKASNDKIEDYTIRSPIAGTIIDKSFKQGDKIEAGKTLCTIFDLSYLVMNMNVDELDISKVKVGQKVEITADANEGKNYVGEVTKISINGNTSNGVTVYPVTVRIDETDGLLPGMNVDATIKLESKEDVLTVPVAAVQRGNKVLVNNKHVNLEDTENVTPSEYEGYSYVNVIVGISNKDYIEIIEGLEENYEIIIVPNIEANYPSDMMYTTIGMNY